MEREANKIPLVRAAFRQPFDIAMQAYGLSSGVYFEKVGLPMTDDEKPDDLLPEKPFWNLINLVAREGNIPDFGIQVAQLTPWHKIASLAPLIQSSNNLETLLGIFCEIASSQSNTSSFFLQHEDSHWVFGSDTENLFSGDRQMELYRVTSMLQLVQLAAGSGWRPHRVDLQMPYFELFPQDSLYANAELRFSQPHSQIHVPEILLKMPVHLDIPPTTVSNQPYDIDLDLAGTLRQLIAIYTASGNSNLASIAEVAGLSVRTLQRRLQDSGLNFKQLVNEARYDLAKLKLQSKDHSITEIASSLGYADSAHFSRAFRNWAGQSPSQYRKNWLK